MGECRSYNKDGYVCKDGFIQSYHCSIGFRKCLECGKLDDSLPNCQLEDIERNPHFNEDGSPKYYKEINNA